MHLNSAELFDIALLLKEKKQYWGFFGLWKFLTNISLQALVVNEL